MLCASVLSEESSSTERGETLGVYDKLEIVSECWVEPLNGTVVTGQSELGHFSGSGFCQIPDAVSPRDYVRSF